MAMGGFVAARVRISLGGTRSEQPKLRAGLTIAPMQRREGSDLRSPNWRIGEGLEFGFRGDDAAPPYGDGADAQPAGAQPYGQGEAEARASDACSWAVEGEMGDDARVDSITKTEPNNGGWYVTGTASRLGGEVRSFGCSFRGGRVVDVSFG